EVVDQFLHPHRVGPRQDALLQRAADEGIGSGVHIDREGRNGIFGGGPDRIGPETFDAVTSFRPLHYCPVGHGQERWRSLGSIDPLAGHIGGTTFKQTRRSSHSIVPRRSGSERAFRFGLYWRGGHPPEVIALRFGPGRCRSRRFCSLVGDVATWEI